VNTSWINWYHRVTHIYYSVPKVPASHRLQLAPVLEPADQIIWLSSWLIKHVMRWKLREARSPLLGLCSRLSSTLSGLWCSESYVFWKVAMNRLDGCGENNASWPDPVQKVPGSHRLQLRREVVPAHSSGLGLGWERVLIAVISHNSYLAWKFDKASMHPDLIRYRGSLPRTGCSWLPYWSLQTKIIWLSSWASDMWNIFLTFLLQYHRIDFLFFFNFSFIFLGII
jgi:hypothetical protein